MLCWLFLTRTGHPFRCRVASVKATTLLDNLFGSLPHHAATRHFYFESKPIGGGGRELGPPRAERKTMIMRENTGDDVGISPKLD
jgi:hypothetical protein